MLLAFSRVRLGMLLSILKCIRPPLMMKIYPAQNVNSAKVEKPCCIVFHCINIPKSTIHFTVSKIWVVSKSFYC